MKGSEDTEEPLEHVLPLEVALTDKSTVESPRIATECVADPGRIP